MTSAEDRSWARYDDPAWRRASGLAGFDRPGAAARPLDPGAPSAPWQDPAARPRSPQPAPPSPASEEQPPTRAIPPRIRPVNPAKDRGAREGRLRMHLFAAGLAIFAGCFGLVVKAGTPGDDGGDEFADDAAAMTLATSTPAPALIVLPAVTSAPALAPKDIAAVLPTATPAAQSAGASARQTVIAAATARAERVAVQSDGSIATATVTTPAEAPVAQVVQPTATTRPRPTAVPAQPTSRARTRSSS